MSKYTTESFIKKAGAVHGSKYNYSDVVYTTSQVKVKISCATHGVFTQTPASHLFGRGCPYCAPNYKLTKAKFLEASKAAHGSRFDYSRVVYVNTETKILIVCGRHGEFLQLPRDHMRGCGCPLCGRESSGASRRNTTEMFIRCAEEMHGKRYDYSLVDYHLMHSKVDIVCKIHGVFSQSYADHIHSGTGCPRCAFESTGKMNSMSQEGFTEKAKSLHGERYDYSKSKYTGSHNNLGIVCKLHGIFYQTPSNHFAGKGCPSCPCNRDQPTYVYLLRGNNAVKVGIAMNLKTRMYRQSLTQPFTSHLVEKWLISDFPSAYRLEQAVHLELSQFHAGFTGFDGHSEWFTCSPEHAAKVIVDLIGEKAP